MSTISVLHVDDEPGLLDITKVFLEKKGDLNVISAASGKEALKAIKSGNIDVVVSDYDMPEMDGIELLKSVKKKDPFMPFILFTGRGREEIAIEALNNGASYYLQKGGSPKAQFAELHNFIHQAVNSKRSERALRESEERYRAVVESQNELICRFTKDMRIIFANDAFCRYYGVKSDDISGTKIGKRVSIPEDDRIKLIKHFKSLTIENPVGEIEHCIIFPDGTKHWQHWRDTAFFTPNGKFKEYQSVGTDITETKVMQTKLIEKVNYVEALMDSIPAPVFYRDVNGIYHDCNKAFEALMCRSREDILGKNITDFYPEEYGRVYAEKDNEIVQSPHLQQYEFAITNGKGEKLDVMFSKTARYRADGTVDGIVGVIVDITQRNRMAKKVQNDLNFIEAVKNSIPIPLFYRDVEGVFRDCNTALEEFLGRSRDNIVGKRLDDIFDEEYMKECMERDHDVITKGGIQKYTCQIPRRNGELRSCFVQKSALHDADNNIIGVVGVFHDVSSQIEMENTIRESEEKFRTLADNTYDWETWIGPDRKYIYISPSCRRITGYNTDYFMNTPIEEWVRKICVPDYADAVLNHYAKSADENTGMRHFDFKIVTKAGKEKWISHYSLPVFYSDGRWAGRREVMRDVTGRKNTEEKLSLANEKLQLVSNVTRHDIMTQVTALMAYSDIMREFCRNDDNLIVLLDKMNSILSFISHRMDFARDYQEIGIKSPDWTEVRSSFETEFKSFPDTRNVKLTVDIDESLEVLGDPLFPKCFGTLLENSLRHGGRGLSEIRVSAEKSDDAMKIIYEDNGVGISPAYKEEIFSRKVGKNNGYSLFLVKTILSMTEMTICECGEEGKGVRFEITVPKKAFRMDE